MPRAVAWHRWAGALGVVLAAAPVRAQLVEGRLAGPEGEGPAPGVLVLALTPDGTVGGRAITDADGLYRIVLSRPGTWMLRAEQLGYQVEEWRVEVPPEGARLADRALTVRPLSIRGVDVVSSERCSRTGDPGRLATLWAEARTVLTAVAAGPGTEARFEVEQFVVTRAATGGEGGPVTSEVRDTVWIRGALPMFADDTERLLADGFVRPGVEEGQYVYYAPDARTLLSDAFLTSHCFRTEPHPDGGRIGLAFRPVDGVSRFDIEGVFWLPVDPAFAPVIEFTYTDHPWDFRRVRDHVLASLGGRVELRYLPDLGWIVNAWTLRMPLPTRDRGADDRGRPRALLPLVQERGAVVLRVQLGRGSGG